MEAVTPERQPTVPGDMEVTTNHLRQKAFVRVSKIAAIVEVSESGPSKLIFTSGGELEICGDAQYWRREIAIVELEYSKLVGAERAP